MLQEFFSRSTQAFAHADVTLLAQHALILKDKSPSQGCLEWSKCSVHIFVNLKASQKTTSKDHAARQDKSDHDSQVISQTNVCHQPTML